MPRKIILSGLILGIALLAYAFSESNVPYLDRYTDEYFTTTTSEAALAYATVRGVNAAVSVLKESQVEVSPAGVGINIAAGQILDPIDDMTERLSSVLVTALVSLGLQKLIFEIGQVIPLKLLSGLSLLFLLPLWLPVVQRTFLLSQLIRLAVVLALLRFVLPVSALISDSLYQHLLRDEIETAQNKLSVISVGSEDIGSFDSTPKGGVIFSISSSTKKKIDQARELFHHVSENADNIIASLLKLTTLYVSLFILQIIVVPVAMLWMMVMVVNTILKSSLSGSFQISSQTGGPLLDQPQTPQD